MLWKDGFKKWSREIERKMAEQSLAAENDGSILFVAPSQPAGLKHKGRPH